MAWMLLRYSTLAQSVTDGSHFYGLRRDASSARRSQKVNKFNPGCVEARLLGFFALDFDGRFRLVRTLKRTSYEDRWLIVSACDLISA